MFYLLMQKYIIIDLKKGNYSYSGPNGQIYLLFLPICGRKIEQQATYSMTIFFVEHPSMMLVLKLLSR